MTYYNVKICICMTYAENNWIVFIQGSRRDSTDVLKLSEICHTERFTTIELNHQLQEDQLLCCGNLCVCPSPIIKETADTTLTPQGSNLKGKFSPVDLTVGLDIQTFQRPQVYQLDKQFHNGLTTYLRNNILSTKLMGRSNVHYKRMQCICK